MALVEATPAQASKRVPYCLLPNWASTIYVKNLFSKKAFLEEEIGVKHDKTASEWDLKNISATETAPLPRGEVLQADNITIGGVK